MSRHAKSQQDEEYLEHVRQLVDLWALDRISPTDLTPHARGVLTLWNAAFEQVKRFQQQLVRVEWIQDHQYQAVAHQAERLLALMGYFRGKKIGLSLREALQLTDPIAQDEGSGLAVASIRAGAQGRLRGRRV